MNKCKSCGGEYEPTQADGIQYFHACPPVWDAQASKYVERADKRDENVVVTGVDKTGKSTTAIKSAGKGVTKL